MLLASSTHEKPHLKFSENKIQCRVTAHNVENIPEIKYVIKKSKITENKKQQNLLTTYPQSLQVERQNTRIEIRQFRRNL